MTNQATKDLVLARLEVLPSNASISIGSFGQLSRDEMIAHVKKSGDKAGEKITEIEMDFLRDLKSGNFYEALTANSTAV
ncbi:MAG: hypothetical protein Q7K16_01530 [Candidatus Azambacteria bacterium]|nr:hypothetical protein [Candidatus Azambacteria bacterium]